MDTRVHSRSRKAGSSKSASLRAEGSPFRTNCAAMSVPRTNFRAGDRVRGAEGFEEIRGFVEAMLVTGQDWAAQDLLVRFDRPVRIFDDEPPTWTFCHSAHNFEFIDESETAPGLPQDLAYSQSAPPPSLLPAHSDPLLPPTSLPDNPRPKPRTGYAKKRRLLREHRRSMRIMQELVNENGLTSELEERLTDETGNTNFWLGVDSDMDHRGNGPQYGPQALYGGSGQEILCRCSAGRSRQSRHGKGPGPRAHAAGRSEGAPLSAEPKSARSTPTPLSSRRGAAVFRSTPAASPTWALQQKGAAVAARRALVRRALAINSAQKRPIRCVP